MNHLNFFAEQLAGRFPVYATLLDSAKRGLLDMIYNLGLTGLFPGFAHFMGFVDNQDWLNAAASSRTPAIPALSCGSVPSHLADVDASPLAASCSWRSLKCPQN